MKKQIISTLLATSMFVSAIAPAHSALISNGGKPTYSITDIQAKLDSGEWTNYAGVVTLNDFGVRVGPSGNFLFANTFKPGMALPEITDVAGLQKALDSKQIILVASNDWIVPVPAVFVELGKQNGVDGLTFMAHYLEGTIGLDSDAFGEYAKSQTQAVLDTLGVTQVTVDAAILVKTGLSEAQAKAIADAAASLAVEEANKKIASLTADKVSLLSEISTLQAEVTRLNTMISTISAEHADQIEALEIQVRKAKEDLAWERLTNLGTDTALTAANLEIAELRSTIVDLRYDITQLAPVVSFTFDNAQEVLNNPDSALVNHRGTPGQYAPGTEDYDYDVAEFNEAVSVDLDTFTGIIEVINPDFNNYINYATVVDGQVVRSFNTLEDARQYGGIAGQGIVGGQFSIYDAAPEAFLSSAEDTVTIYVASTPAGWTFDGHSISADLAADINAAIADAYEAGYADGYADGYIDGFNDGFAAGQMTN